MCGSQESHNEIQGYGQEMPVMGNKTIQVNLVLNANKMWRRHHKFTWLKFLPLIYHHSHSLAIPPCISHFYPDFLVPLLMSLICQIQAVKVQSGDKIIFFSHTLQHHYSIWKWSRACCANYSYPYCCLFCNIA